MYKPIKLFKIVTNHTFSNIKYTYRMFCFVGINLTPALFVHCNNIHPQKNPFRPQSSKLHQISDAKIFPLTRPSIKSSWDVLRFSWEEKNTPSTFNYCGVYLIFQRDYGMRLKLFKLNMPTRHSKHKLKHSFPQ